MTSTPTGRGPFAHSATRAFWMPWAPALGVAGGLLQALPIRAGFDCCCMPWAAIAGAIATFAIVQKASARMEPAEGALVGLITGSVAGLVGGVVAALREMLFASGGLIAPLLSNDVELTSSDVLRFVWAGAATFFAYLALSPALGAIGGAVGAAIAKPSPSPPPPA
ncbi:hypothetical protein [Sandaracinus amylolyticus]|uniref:Uncharacterized protein n=1 Tax=Sandaracinus amylolyticus TaxID=927083 RepID=A0A0F6SGB8_9BACT|nr:hypothetical protein [Sandaracinus amylolyticus]AKF08419.1 hypothetical protein DB32_005568 [Sandaracinus amylolyticus]